MNGDNRRELGHNMVFSSNKFSNSDADTSGFPVESMRTKDDFPTLGAPTRQSVGISRSTTGIALKVCKIKILHLLEGMYKTSKWHHHTYCVDKM